MLKLLASKIHTRSVQGIDRLQINSNTGYSISPVAVDHKHFSHGRCGQGRVRAAVLVGIRKAKYKTSWAPYTWRYTGVQVCHLPKKHGFHSLIFHFSVPNSIVSSAHSALTVNQTLKCPAKESLTRLGIKTGSHWNILNVTAYKKAFC